MPTEDVLILLESRIIGLSVDRLQHLVLNLFCLIVIIAVLQPSPPQLHGNELSYPGNRSRTKTPM